MVDRIRQPWSRGWIEMWDAPPRFDGAPDDPVPNARRLDLVEGGVRASARHAIRCVGADLVGASLLVSAGGTSGVHERSVLVLDERCFCAVGTSVIALALPDLRLLWSCTADDGSCFGLHFAPGGAAIISHGELFISRVSLDGALEWQAGGADIFTGPFVVGPSSVTAEDWDGRRYEFALDTGRELAR